MGGFNFTGGNCRLKIAVAGAGYVGLSLAVLLSRQYEVRIVDVVQEKVNMINRRKSPIEDAEIVNYLLSEKLDLTATADEKIAYDGVDFVIVAVPTNYDCEKNSFDTSTIEAVLRQVREVNDSAVVVIKSTIPVGYTAKLREETGDRKLLFSPEFLRESRALYDNLYPSRIIVGTDFNNEMLTHSAKQFAEILRGSALKKDAKVLIMSSTEAEAVKLFANTYLALRVSYFNELDTYAELSGLDTRSIIEGVCLDPRIGDCYNNPSFGYGGYCLPKDTKQLLANYGSIPQRLMGAVVSANQVRKEHIAQQVRERLKKENKSVVGIYRLAMKAGSDNFRESAILGVMELLRETGAEFLIYEPTLESGSEYQNCRIENNFDEFVAASGVIIANRRDELLNCVSDKLYSRDIFGQN